MLILRGDPRGSRAHWRAKSGRLSEGPCRRHPQASSRSDNSKTNRMDIASSLQEDPRGSRAGKGARRME